MFALVRFGSQQIKVQVGDFLRVPFLGDSVGKNLEIPLVALEEKTGLLLGDSELKASKVKAKVLSHGKFRKMLIFKKKRRKGYRRTGGHRQKFTSLQIVEISSPSSKVALEKVAKKIPVPKKGRSSSLKRNSGEAKKIKKSPQKMKEKEQLEVKKITKNKVKGKEKKFKKEIKKLN